MLLNQLYQIRYLLLVELFLLLVLAIFELIPFLVVFSLLLLITILLISFRSPLTAVFVLLTSILIDAVIPYKNISTGPTVLIEEIFFLLFVGLFIVKYLLHFNESKKIPGVLLLWVLFLIWSLPIGLIVGIEKIRILILWKNYFAGFFILTLVYFTLNKSFQIKSLIFGLIIWGLCLAIIEFKVLIDLGGFSSGIIGLYFKKNLLSVSWGRSNYLASFFVLIIPITIGYLFYTKSIRSKIFIFSGLIIMSFAMMLTLSRGGILALALALIFLSFRTLKAKTLIPFLALISVIILVILLNPLTYVLIEGVSNLEASGSVYSRINFYEDTWRAFLNNPVTGVGFGNLGYYATFILGEQTSSSAHNIVLGMLGEVGLVGGIFFFSILATVITSVFRGFLVEKDESLKILKWSFLSAIIGGCLHSLVEPTFEGFQFSIIFWAIVGLSFNLHLIKTNQSVKRI